ncbi:hypothetical protein TWF569_003568 [Orbilia oligospora]|uniref:O-methylsterigmatocystin oxidoreductase n=1 Tax=Orbilia oligospora TaxID=2813651 RepID=A0A7C8JX18_ORBOL|nr:hypothetical protein TWF706_011715 [Orbilia oligospora]KAF3119876.1 hypothetical protein TWF569_003568 [Orbilia oligospora]KAF3146039.1 hypothetical protein TWF703_005585 [Orbilia oligospora]
MLWGVFLIAAFLGYLHFVQIRRRRLLPPGPKPVPLLGNIRDFPPPGVPEFKHWLKLKDQYGGISSLSVLGLTMILIHDKKIAHEILDKNSSKTSGRPRMEFAGELCGYKSLVIFRGYGTTFRLLRKFLHQELGTKPLVGRFREVQETEVNRQLVRSLRRPEDWVKNFSITSGATVLKAVYGYNVEADKPDTLVEQVDRMMKEFSRAAVPKKWIVDIFPVLRYLPEGFPGTSFKQTARAWKRSFQETAQIPYQFVRHQMAAGCHRQSYVSKLVERNQKESYDGSLNPEHEDAIIYSAANLYGGGADTTAIGMTSFTLAMILYPEVQRKAQEEIDRVVGSDRLPGFEDRERLPYINAIIKEILRWWVVGPLAFIHVADEDIEYNGYLIPKGSYIVPNIWWILHDPEVYANPDKFDPERFLSPRNEPDPEGDVFGYGRRICPGRFFADANIYLNVAKSIAAFNINKAVDKDGKEVDVEAKPTPGVFSYVEKFQFRITPRSSKHAELVNQLDTKDLWGKSDSGMLKDIKIIS